MRRSRLANALAEDLMEVLGGPSHHSHQALKSFNALKWRRLQLRCREFSSQMPVIVRGIFFEAWFARSSAQRPVAGRIPCAD